MGNELVLVNGKQKDTVSVYDRALNYGDGLFETILVSNGRLYLVDSHLKRLRNGCDRLKIPYPENEIIEDISYLNISDSGILKIIITRGVSNRGYRCEKNPKPNRIMTFRESDAPSKFNKQHLNLCVCDTRLSNNANLAGIKHLNRIEQVLARSEWNDEFGEGIMLDQDGNVIEGTMSNAFFVKDGSLYTPDITNCGISGVMRTRIIEFAPELDIPMYIEKIPVSELLSADEIFMSNSIRGVMPVSHIDFQSIEENQNKSWEEGVVTKKVLARISSDFAEHD